MFIGPAEDRVLRDDLILVTDWIDLETDLVNTVEEIGSSTYLNDEAWAVEYIEKAIAGRKLQVRIRVPGRLERLLND